MSSDTRAATSCIQEPMFDTSAAIQMLRNTDVRSGDQTGWFLI
jgi:hypothetical protein